VFDNIGAAASGIPRKELVNEKDFSYKSGGVLAVIIFSAGQVVHAQPSVVDYSVVARGPHDRVWAKVTPQADQAGAKTFITNSFTEVATYMHFWQDGIWQESRDLIELTKSGGAEAVHGAWKAYFPANLNSTEGITLSSVSNRLFRIRPLGLFYYDSSTGKAAKLGTLKDCQAMLVPPNRVVYSDALDGIKADLRVTYTKAMIESDLILLQQPNPPEFYGMNPSSTKLELWHEWDGASSIRNTPVVLADNDFTDTITDFGDVLFAAGRAFMSADEDAPQPGTPAMVRLRDTTDDSSVPVAKEWLEMSGRTLLIERVRWSDVASRLYTLPKTAQQVPSASRASRLLCMRDLPERSAQESPNTPATVVASYNPQGLVFDYVIVSGSGSYTFSPQTTYWIGSMQLFGGTVTFFGTNTIKFANNASLGLYGIIHCNGNASSPTVLTSENEDAEWGYPGAGEHLPWSTGAPTFTASKAIWLYYASQNLSLSGFKIRWAKTAVQVDGNGCSISHSLVDSSLQWCQTGVYVNNCGFTAQNSAKCALTTEYSGPGCYGGSFSDICTGDSDANGLPDSWEYRYFGRKGINPSTDSDGDCSSNLQEYYIGTSPVTPPQLTSQPVYSIVPAGQSVTLTASINNPCLTVQWLRGGIIMGTGTSYTIANPQAGDPASYICQVLSGVFPINQINTVVACDSWGLNIWNAHVARTNGRSATPYLTRTHPTGWPATAPTITRDPNCILSGLNGLTGVSPCNSWEGVPHQAQVTALTRRHGYCRGHGAGTPNHYGLGSAWDGRKVWFCTADSQIIEATVRSAWVRVDYDSHQNKIADHTIVLFNEDLPLSITPLKVAGPPYANFPVLFRTCQANYVSANEPPAGVGLPMCPAFNDYGTSQGGDSGSANMIPSTDGYLIFVQGTGCTGPNAQMQADMDALCADLGLNSANYQMNWYPVP
jgi:hypothetical protein